MLAGHLKGEVHIGLYPLLDGDKCWWLAADFDGPEAMFDALMYVKVHDYHDELTGVLASSLAKRAPGYASLGFPDPRKLPYTPSASTSTTTRSGGAAEYADPGL